MSDLSPSADLQPNKSFRLASKLLLCFGLICGTFLGIGGIFFFSLRSIEKLNTAERSSALGEISELYLVGKNLGQIQAEVVRHVVASAPAELKQHEELIAQLTQANERIVSGWTGPAESGEGRLYANVKEAEVIFTRRTQELLALSRVDQTDGPAAIALRMQAPAYNAFRETLAALQAYEEAEARTIATTTTTQIKRTEAVGDSLLTFGMLTVLGTAWMVIRMLRALRKDKRSLQISVAQYERAERERQEGEARYLMLLENSPNAILVLCDDEIVLINPAGLALLGAERPEQILGHPPNEIVHPDERSEIALRTRQVAEGKQPPTAARRLVRLDGSVVEAESTVVSFLYEKRPALLLILRDVTQERLQEKQLRAAEENYRSIFDNAQEGIFQNTPEGKYLSANPALARMLGFGSPEQLIRERNDLEKQGYVDPTLRKEFRDRLEREGFINNYEYQVKRRDGGAIWVSENVRVVRDAAGRSLLYEGSVQDITERKRAEEELRRSVERFRSFTEATSQIVWQTDPEGNVIEDLPSWRDFTGQSREEVLGFGWSDCIHPEDREHVLQHWSECKRAQVPYEIEYRMRGADGAYRNFSVRGVPVRDAQGATREWVGINADVTGKKRAEKELFESQLMLRTVLDNIPQRVFWKDTNCTYLGCNRAFAGDAGFSNSQSIVGKTDFDASWSEFAAQYRVDDRRVMDSGTPKFAYEEPLQNAAGRRLWLRSNKVPLRDTTGKVYGILGTYEDITESRQAAERIEQQAALLDLAHDAIMVRDLQGHLLFWSKGAERLYGYTAEEALGQKLSTLCHIGNNDSYEKANAATIVRGEWFGELQQMVKDGSIVTVEARKTLVRDEKGNPKAVLSINNDITERKKIEEHFLRAQRMESIGTLASGVAHDLNNILLPIMMAAPILREETDPAERDKFLDIVESSAQRGADIVKQVLTFARGAVGDRLLLKPIYLLQEVAKIAGQTFPKSIDLKTSFDENIRSLEADPTQLHQVLLNLCINSRDAMPEGGKLRLSAENFDVDAHYANMMPGATAGPHVLLQVTDTGTGIPPDIQPKIFDPFFTTKDIGQGTGLGLSTVAGIVRGHGGFLQLESEPGHTRFKIFLPAKETGQSSGDSENEESLPRGDGQTILVVDDELSIRQLAEFVLEGNGYKVLLAEDGPTALAVFAQQPGLIDIVVTDLAMPMMDGIMLVRTLRRIAPRVKIIVSTGRTDEAKSSELAAFGIDGYLMKPYTTRTFLHKLEQVLRGGWRDAA
ncbi:MAG: PAS domain S-box protein [Chthoniobacterales bacterium]|nr:PAS domain S-box protein [Chthoniobacterales bacterium]